MHLLVGMEALQPLLRKVEKEKKEILGSRRAELLDAGVPPFALAIGTGDDYGFDALRRQAEASWPWGQQRRAGNCRARPVSSAG